MCSAPTVRHPLWPVGFLEAVITLVFRSKVKSFSRQGRINKFSAPGQIIEVAHDHPPETIARFSHLTLSQQRH